MEIPAAKTESTKFQGIAYIRVGSHKKKLSAHPEKEKVLWKILLENPSDWSAKIIPTASLEDLEPDAVKFARKQFIEKNPKFKSEINKWDDKTFLNKAKVSINGKITTSALILLGKETSAHLLSPAHTKITWVLKDDNNNEKDYEHFNLPFILAPDKILAKIRNLKIRHLPSGTLFPNEVSQYDDWVIRETLHNCIAHQDYSLGGKITIVETPSYLLFTNLGSFLAGSVEEVIENDSPPEVYRNKWLSDAMGNLNMIDTIGSGIKRMYSIQKKRSFPMPTHDLNRIDRVSTKINGEILDENYTNLLIKNHDLELTDAIALDKVQKKIPLTESEFKKLKQTGLIEGRRPNLFVSAEIASLGKEKANYIKNKALDKDYYKKLIIEFLKKYNSAARIEINELVTEKLSNTLNEKQKKQYIANLLQEMKKEESIRPTGTTRWARWFISKK